MYHNLNEQPFKQSKKYIPKIPTDIIKEISKYLNIQTLIKLSQVSKLFKSGVKIINFTKIDSETIKMTDEILQLPILNDLQSLYAHNNKLITDQGIKNLKLIKLNASENPNITDQGIKNLKLIKLDSSHNSNITNIGIKNFNLRIQTLLMYHG